MYTPYKEYDILSLKEAYDEILKGNFRLIDVLDKNSNIEVTDASLIYQLDSKGFYQPVYDFTANIDKDINFLSNHFLTFPNFLSIPNGMAFFELRITEPTQCTD